MKKAKGTYKQSLLQDQRDWVNYGRDEEARKFMDVGLGKAFSYTRATIKRIHELQVVEYNMNLSPNEYGRAKADTAFLTEEDDPEYYRR